MIVLNRTAKGGVLSNVELVIEDGVDGDRSICPSHALRGGIEKGKRWSCPHLRY